VCLLFVLSSLAAYAQSASTGALTGTVTDPTGAVLRNAQIALRNIGTGETRGAITDQGGSYHLSLLPPGKYELTVEATGFAPLVVREVLIRITEVTSLATQLAIKGLREGKVRQLEAQYPYLTDDLPSSDPKQTMLASVEQLDLSTVLKVSQAVQGEIDLEKLIAAVMRLAVEQAGAERGLRILPHADSHRIEAEARSSNERVTIDLRPTTIGTGDVPPSVFQYVLRTRERVLLQDASTSKEFAHDEYLRRHHVRSVVCIPLLKQTRLIGIIYRENRLTSGVFTPARMALLEVLASDAAISLENARLYGELQERDLYYRLNVFDIYIPPLRQRRADIRALVLGFLREFDHTAGRGRDITSEAMDTLLHHGWPGNVREPQQRPRAGDHPVRGRGDSSRGSVAVVGIAGAG